MYNFGEVVQIGTVNYPKKRPMHNCDDIPLRKGESWSRCGVELNEEGANRGIRSFTVKVQICANSKVFCNSESI